MKFGIYICEMCGRDYESGESNEIKLKTKIDTLDSYENPNWICQFCGHDNNPAPGRCSVFARRIAKNCTER